ncbi:hypothetical protein JCM6882_000875 [Rhodosporidiobolus microsporus]
MHSTLRAEPSSGANPDRDPFLPTSTRPTRPSSSPFSRLTNRRGRLFLLLTLPTVAILLFATVGDRASLGVGENWRKEVVAERLNQGLVGLRQSWAGAKSWGWRHGDPVDVDAGGPIEVDMLPLAKELPPADEEERFVGYLPHSGFHNQRSALTNALFLAALLNRTLLVPPVWIGWPPGLEYYEDLQQSWTNAILMHPTPFGLSPPSLSSSPASSSSAPLNASTSPDPLYHPASYPSTFSDYPSLTAPSPSSRREAAAAALASKTAKWRAQGWEVRPDGYPDVPDMKESECKSIRPECRSLVNDTFIAWEQLVDLRKAARVGGVKLRDRWDMRERAVEGLLNVTREDVLVFEDEERYDFRFVDDPSTPSPSPLITPIDAPSSRYRRTVSIPAMRALPQRVLLLSSLFGYERVLSLAAQSPEGQGQELHQRIALSLAFSSPHILEPAREIRDTMGGSEAYVGAHARVGDGIFVRKAEENVDKMWQTLVERLGVEEGARTELFERVKGGEEVLKPSSTVDNATFSPFSSASTRSTCRSALHVSPSLLPLNTPLFLATDSPTPVTDPALRLFRQTFPCIFLLSDFSHLAGVERMKRLVNEVNGVGLGRLFTPFLEATVAAMGKEVVGTTGSTFSEYAEKTLHRAFVVDPAPYD